MSTPPAPEPGRNTPPTPEQIKQILEGGAALFSEAVQSVASAIHTPDPSVVLDGFQPGDLQVGDYSYDPRDIRDGAMLMLECGDEVRRILAAMHNELIPRLDHWKGQSKESFTETMRSIARNLGKTSDWLLDASNHLIRNSDEVQRDDEALAAYYGK
ncbi:WXG100 family type VII secretion target [Streptomyces sp. NPDC048629]|uniref:WXG100 family type VII secretion target n=1 Tax=Streptomyces sp. NPDC048629 TaxID=3154824 RepID=UPI003414F75D